MNSLLLFICQFFLPLRSFDVASICYYVAVNPNVCELKSPFLRTLQTGLSKVVLLSLEALS